MKYFYHEGSTSLLRDHLQIHTLVNCFNCSPWMGCMDENVFFNKHHYLYNPIWSLCIFLPSYIILIAFLSSPSLRRSVIPNTGSQIIRNSFNCPACGPKWTKVDQSATFSCRLNRCFPQSDPFRKKICWYNIHIPVGKWGTNEKRYAIVDNKRYEWEAGLNPHFLILGFMEAVYKLQSQRIWEIIW